MLATSWVEEQERGAQFTTLLEKSTFVNFGKYCLDCEIWQKQRPHSLWENYLLFFFKLKEESNICHDAHVCSQIVASVTRWGQEPKRRDICQATNIALGIFLLQISFSLWSPPVIGRNSECEPFVPRWKTARPWQLNKQLFPGRPP